MLSEKPQRILQWLICLLSPLFLMACSYNFLPSTDYFEDNVTQTFSKVLNIVSQGDSDALSEAAIPEFSMIENYQEIISQVLSATGDPRGATLIYAENRKSDRTPDAIDIYYAIYEYKNGDNFDILELALQDVDGKCCYLRHINIKKNKYRSETYHNFNSHEFSLKRLLFITLMVGTVLSILFAIVMIIKDKDLKYKWLWVIFAILGTYGLTFNWTTEDIAPNFISMQNGGGVRFSFIKFNLLGGSFTRLGLFQPWIFDWGFPLGAAVYLVRRRVQRRKGNLE